MDTGRCVGELGSRTRERRRGPRCTGSRADQVWTGGLRMSARVSQRELESYLWGAAVLLRGLIDAGDYKQFIFPLLFYKRVSDVWEEEYQAALTNSNDDLSYAQFAENHRFQIPQGAQWNEVRQAPKNVGAAIQKAM